MEPSGPTPDVYKELARGRVRAALFGELEGSLDGSDAVGGAQVRIGRYRIEGALGEGGMGSVLLAHDETLDREVAIKVLHSGQGDPRRLRREAQALARLSHPNVVQVFEVGEHEGQLFIAMERVRGQTLRQWQRVARTWQECVALYVQAGRGLAAAHAVELVHRDFKPGNCIVDEQGRVRVLDFGLAREVGGSSSDSSVLGPNGARRVDTGASAGSDTGPGSGSNLNPNPNLKSGSGSDALREAVTRAGAAVGTIAYMSPEQWEGRGVGPHSDQFGFCVSLYEALYGVRPFAGATVDSLMLAVSKGQVADAPATEVPAAIRAIVRRGLQPQPSERWPSMDALLDALEARLHRRRRGWWWGSLVMVAGLGGGALWWSWSASTSATECADGQRQLEGQWDDARREQVEQAFVASGVGYAAPTWERVERRLDLYAERWVATRQAACEAARASEQSEAEQQLDLRMRCLDRRRTALREAVDVLADADKRVVQRAVSLVEALPSVERCDDVEALAAELPPPDDPQLAATVLAMRERLVQAEALARAGRLEPGFAIADEVVTEASAAGYEPIHAEALMHRAIVRREQGKHAEARADAEQAYMLARAEGHDAVAARAAVQLVYVIGRHLSERDEAIRWSRLAEGLVVSQDPSLQIELRRMVGLVHFEHGFFDEAREELAAGLALLDASARSMPVVRVEFLVSLATVSVRQGDNEQAEPIVEQALSLTRQTLGPMHPRVAKLLVSRAIRLHAEGRYAQARDDYEVALSILEAALGSTHPAVAITLSNLGNTLERMGLHEQALSHHQTSYEIRAEVLGDEHPQTGESLVGQGIALNAMKRYAEAEAVFERARIIFEASYGSEHYSMGSALAGLGRAQGNREKHEQAEANLRAAMSILKRSIGARHMKIASILMGIADQQVAQGDRAGARASLDEALEIQAEALPAEHPHVALALCAKARLEQGEGHIEQAQVLSERSLAIAEVVDISQEELGLIQLTLVKALAESDPERARTLAEQAAEHYRTGSVADDENPATQWLAEHPR